MSETTTDAQSGLIAKLCAVMAAVERVPKRGRNEHFGYSYATEGDVLDSVRKSLAEHGIFLSYTVTGLHEREVPTRSGSQFITRIDIEFTFHDATSADKLTFKTVGEGMDGGDKGAYKALTGALKFALTKTFLIPTGDDPEADSSTDKDERAPTGKLLEAAGAATRPGMASDKQIKFVWSLAKKIGWTPEDMKAYLKEQHGISSSEEMTKDIASKTLDYLQAELENRSANEPEPEA